jgi:PRC-barrel domain
MCNRGRSKRRISVGRQAQGAWDNGQNTEGKSIGKVEDLLLEKQSNNITYAVVGFGGFLGVGAKYPSHSSW